MVITPAERPNLQVFFLGQLASLAESELVRERMIRVETPEGMLEIIAAADPAITG
jgi:mannitol/fructose-specific phosphotransferase system IIA component (Ntr-type)